MWFQLETRKLESSFSLYLFLYFQLLSPLALFQIFVWNMANRFWKVHVIVFLFSTGWFPHRPYINNWFLPALLYSTISIFISIRCANPYLWYVYRCSLSKMQRNFHFSNYLVFLLIFNSVQSVLSKWSFFVFKCLFISCRTWKWLRSRTVKIVLWTIYIA